MQNTSIYDLFINLNYFLHTKIGQTFKHTCDQVGYIVVQMLLKFKFDRSVNWNNWVVFTICFFWRRLTFSPMRDNLILGFTT